MNNLKKIDTGTFHIDLSQLPSLRVFPRAISNRASEVEVFMVDNEILIYATDLSGNVTYIAREKDSNIKMFNIVEDQSDNLTDIRKRDKEDVGKMEEELLGEDFLDFLTNLETVDEEDTGIESIEKELKNKEIEYCHFCTSTDLLQILSELDEVEMVVKEDEVIVTSMEEGIRSKFDRIKAYTEMEEVLDMIELPVWEDFPLERVKSIIPVIEQIEEANYRQFLTLKDGKMYTFSDIIAIETSSGHMGRNYNLNSEVLRILKYSTAKNTDIKISELENGNMCLNVDGLNIFFGPMGDFRQNLFDIPRQVTQKKPFIGAVNKDFIDKLKMIKKVYKDKKNILIEVIGEEIALRNDKIMALAHPEGKVYPGTKIVVDIDKLLLALRIADDNNAGFSLYEITEDRATIIVEGKVDVLIDTEEYYKEGDFGYDEA